MKKVIDERAADRRSNSPGVRLLMVIATALLWNIAAGELADTVTAGAPATVLTVLLNLFGGSLSLLAAFLTWDALGRGSSPWVRLVTAPLVGIFVAGFVFLGVEELAPTGGILGLVALLGVGVLTFLFGRKGPWAERWASRIFGLG